MVSPKFLSLFWALLAVIPVAASAPAEGRTHNGKTTAARPNLAPYPLTTGKKFPTSPRRTKTCFIDALGNGEDDGPQILAAAHKCNNGGTLAFLDDLYTIGTPLDLTFLKHVDFDIQGTIKFTDDIDFWIRNQFEYYYQNISSFWQIGGEDVNLFGSGKGVIDGNGQKWYDLFDTQKLNTTFRRPLLLVFDGIKGGQMSGITMRNSPNWNTLIANSSDMIFHDMSVVAGSSSKIPAKNTDGWDTYRSDNIVIQNSVVNNGDDCVSLRGNSTNILVQSLACNGSHGISVGSLGQYYQNQDIVENVYIFNITMTNASDGARIKAWPGVFGEAMPGWVGGGGTGYVNNVVSVA
ncbi:Exopolygalacturonase [Dactylellina cionopaga]|nr:Exopolygalacturonase [Dactylellina cionopaga]